MVLFETGEKGHGKTLTNPKGLVINVDIVVANMQLFFS